MTGSRSAASVVTAAANVALLLFGAAQGMIGSFQYSHWAPVGAMLFCAAILVTCLLAGWGMQSITGAFMPAIGWVIASYVLAMPMSNGSVIVANTTAGKWYLYGGTLSVTAAVVVSFAVWVRAAQRQLPLCHRFVYAVHGPGELGFGDNQRRSQPDRVAVRLLGEHAVLGQPLASRAPAEVAEFDACPQPAPVHARHGIFWKRG
jgi:hypothetical protein